MDEKSLSNPLSVTVPDGFGVESGRKFEIYDRSLKPSKISDMGREARSRMQCLAMVAAAAFSYSLNETACLLKEQGQYKFGIKKNCNDIQRHLKEWYGEMSELLGDRYKMAQDMAVDRMSELDPMFEETRTWLALHLQPVGEEKARLASWGLMTMKTLDISFFAFVGTCKRYLSKGVGFHDMFKHYNLEDRLGKQSLNLCYSIINTQKMYDALDDAKYIKAFCEYRKEMTDYDKLCPTIKELVFGEHSDLFSDEERKRITADCKTLEN